MDKKLNEGEYKFLGELIDYGSKKQRRRFHTQNIGFVLQTDCLISTLNIYDNLELPLLYKKCRNSERKSKVSEIAEYFNLIDKLKSFPKEFNLKEKQKISVACAIICNPKLIVVYQPTENLNIRENEEVLNILKQVNENLKISAIHATKSVHKAAYGARIIELKHGQIVDDIHTDLMYRG